MRRASSAALIALALLLPACGGDSEEATTESAESTPAATTATAQEGEVRVAMKDFKFVPADVTVKQGETVTWVNEDTAQHDAVAADKSGPQSELFNQGGTYSWTAEKAGKISYVCSVHPGMEGTITVE